MPQENGFYVAHYKHHDGNEQAELVVVRNSI